MKKLTLTQEMIERINGIVEDAKNSSVYEKESVRFEEFEEQGYLFELNITVLASKVNSGGDGYYNEDYDYYEPYTSWLNDINVFDEDGEEVKITNYKEVA